MCSLGRLRYASMYITHELETLLYKIFDSSKRIRLSTCTMERNDISTTNKSLTSLIRAEKNSRESSNRFANKLWPLDLFSLLFLFAHVNVEGEEKK